MIKVFLCHSSIDKPKVRKLYTYLRKQGVDAWLDKENLLGGQDWKIEIPKALEDSDAILICLTQSSIDKEGYIQKEIRFALEKALEIPDGRIFLIPVRLEECKVPDKLNNYHWVDLFKKNGYINLMKSLRIREEQVRGKYSTALTTPSEETETGDEEDGSASSQLIVTYNSGKTTDSEKLPSIKKGGMGILVDDLDLSQLPYSIGAKIGNGDYSEVYHSIHKLLGTDAAIKFFHPSISGNPTMQNKLAKNIGIASSFKHPNFIHIYSLKTKANLFAVVMEYVHGGNLRQWVEKNKPDTEIILSILSQIADALDYIHSQHYQSDYPLLHCNIKPENILIDSDPITGKPVAKLSDFGLTLDWKLRASHLTLEGNIPSAAYYISPEQVEDLPKESLDGQSDQYSLAVIAYELLCGARPFDGNDPIAIMFKRMDDDPLLQPSKVKPDLPSEFDLSLLKALHKTPESRYPTCADFIRSLSDAWRASRLRRVREFVETARQSAQMGDFKTARAQLDEAERLEPNDPRSQLAREVITKQAEQVQRYDEAVQNWETAQQKAHTVLDLVTDFPDSKGILVTLGARQPQKPPFDLRGWLTQLGVGILIAAPLAIIFFILSVLWILKNP